MESEEREPKQYPYHLLVVVVFAAMLAGSWQRWTSLIVDIGRETDLPLRILSGEVLYRDVHYIYPPFSPYFNALLYWVFGPHLNTLAFSGIFFTGILTILCYRLSRPLMSPLSASLAVSLIVVLCFFKPAGNLILPYSFAGTHAAIFSLAAIILTLRAVAKGRRIELVFAGVFIGLAVITKQEFGFASAAGVTAYLIFVHRSRVLALVSDVCLAAVPALVIAGMVFGILFANIDSRTLIDDCHLFYTNIPPSLVYYNRFRSGLDDPLASFGSMIGACAVISMFAGAIAALSDRSGKIRRTASLVAVAAASATATFVYLFFEDWDGSPLRAVPFILVGSVGWAWVRQRRTVPDRTHPPETASCHALFILAAYSFALLSSVILRVPSGGFSGSFYIPSALIIVMFLLLEVLPASIGVWAGDARSVLRAKRITVGVCAAAILAMGASFIVRYRTRYTYPITAVRGSLFAEKHSGPAIAEALEFIGSKTAPGETISVLPEGNDLAFLTGRRINFRHQVLIPDFLSEADEQSAIGALERDNVRYVFVLNRAMREFGKVEFGTDFYTTLGGYIKENFALVEVFGAAPGQPPETGKPPFWIKVYERK